MPEPNPFSELSPQSYALPAKLLDRLQTPALIVDLERVRRNARRMIEYAGGVDRWRPHLKTTKMPAVWDELLQLGVRHFKCATTREAHVLSRLAADRGIAIDLLVAYPLRGPGLRRLADIAAAAGDSTRLSVLVEEPSAVAEVAPGLDLFVDVDPGMHRTGIAIDDIETIVAVARAAQHRLRGLHCYDGHQHAAVLAERRRAIFAGYEQVMALTELLAGQGCPIAEVVTAGTPAFQHALAFPGFQNAPFRHRISPGTVVFHDGRSELENADVRLEPAAVVLTRVISHPAARFVTCDAGSKSLAAEAGDPCAFAAGHGELEALTPSEEHLPMRVADGADRPARGSTLLLVPRHVCPTVNLADAAVLLDADNEPRVVEIEARGHELLADAAPDGAADPRH